MNIRAGHESSRIAPGPPARGRPPRLWQQMAAAGTLETLAWLACIAALWVASSGFAGAHEQYVWGAAAWPRAVLLLAAFAVLGQWFSRRRSRNGRASREQDAQHPPDLAGRPATPPVSPTRLAATFALPLVYTQALSWAGFFIATPVFLGVYMAVFGVRRWQHLLGTNLVFCIGVATLFSRLLYVPLPVGELPLFYDVSHFLLALLRAGH